MFGKKGNEIKAISDQYKKYDDLPKFKKFLCVKEIFL